MSQLKNFVGAMLCVLFVSICHAQSVKGSLKDSTGKAVSYATVSLKNSDDNAIIAYTVSNNEGLFTIKIPAKALGKNLTVDVHAMGYLAATKNITRIDTTVDFILTEMAIQLQEVIATTRKPVLRSNGDTLNYKVSDFANPQDQAIIDVIKKMPGITVTKDGTILYNNKQVSGVYLGGDNLLDGQYSIATNNIPQGTVSQVQVIQNNQPIQVLQNKMMTDDVALNLVFKKTAKLHVIGQESIGLGLPGRYDVDLNAMFFKNNYKAINYIGGNNTGYDLQKELASHNLMDYLQQNDNSIPPPVLSLGTAAMPGLGNNRTLFNQAGIINANNLIKLKKNVQLRINAYYFHDRQLQTYNQQTSFFLPGDTISYTEAQYNRSVPGMLHTQFTLNINRPTCYLNNILLMHYKNNISYSALQTDSSELNQSFQDNTRNFSNQFNLITAMKSKKIIQFYSYISHFSEPEKLRIRPGYNESLFNNGVSYAQLVQQVDIPGWYTNNYFSFRVPSKWVTQSYRVGFSLQSQTLSSSLNVVQNNNTINLQSDSAINHVNWTKKKTYVEGAYDLPGIILKARLTLPVTLQQINYFANAHTLKGNRAGIYFNPQLNVKYQVSAENYFNFFYTYRNQVGAITDIYPGYILTNYRTLYANNAELAEQRSYQAGAGFSYRKAIKLFFWNINALYDHARAGNITATIFSNNIQQGIVLPYPNSTDSWIINGSISKYIFVLRSTISGGVQWRATSAKQLQNNILLPFKTIARAFYLNVDTKITNNAGFSYKASLTQTESRSSVAKVANEVKQLVQEAAVNYDPADVVHFKLSGEHYFIRQQGNPDLHYFFADASLRLNIVKWKTDFELSAANFLNVKKYDAVYLSANSFTSSSYILPGRIVVLKAIFKL